MKKNHKLPPQENKTMDYIREHKRGIIGTALFHIVVLMMLLLLGFFTPLPLPGEEGILVNFGTSEFGLGDIEPAPAQNNPPPAEPQKEEEEQTPPPVPVSQPKTQPKVSPPKEVAMTQDYEKTAAIDAAETKRKEDAKKRQQEIDEQNRIKKSKEDQIKKAEQEQIRQQQIEAERIRKADAERKAKEEADRKSREEQQRKISEINSRAQGAFGNNNTGPGGKGTGQGSSQGATFPGGNQGVPTGDPTASNYGQGGSGNGKQGTGVSYSLSGRSAKSLPKPNFPGNKSDESFVIVRITVDGKGNVLSAEPGVQGTNEYDIEFLNAAKDAALKTKFSIKEDVPVQYGTITYIFRGN